MEFDAVVLGRRSIRAFLPDPVPRDKITKIVKLAQWAPSWGNTQPWEIVVADGEKAKRLAQAFSEEVMKGGAARSDIPMPVEFPEVNKKRYSGLGRDLLGFLGIARDDSAGRAQHYLNMFKLFGAPAVIYLVVDARLSVPYACLDLGSIGTTICYAAVQEGLGTIYLAAAMQFPDIVKSVLEIPEDKKVVIGIAIGFPDPDAPAALFRSSRAPLEEILRFA
ncbi:MAG: nitroreductase family protein [Desulfomonile tiedjei]|nr:nitroreductase family protein [Desulfomonile tiedjei]